METIIGVYDNHDQALEAAKTLKTSGFPMKHVSIVGHHQTSEDNGDDEMTLKAGTSVGLGALVGSTVGVLTGVGIFAVPGLGFLFGAGALVGAIAGLDFGLIGGGVVGALSMGLSKEHHEAYDQYLKEGKYLVIVHGPETEIASAKEILAGHGKHVSLKSH